MISRIFIDRPIFAWVLAIIVMLGGIGAILGLPIAQYPDVAPPQVSIRATYPGASAQTLQNSVTQVIEQQLTGIDGLLYFTSSSSSRGQVTITGTFAKGTNPDIAQVQVQNQVQQAVSRLPQQVQQQGLRVTKSNPDFLLIVGAYDETDRMTGQDISDYLVSNLQDPLGRIKGVGDLNVFGSQYAMRIWLNPERLASYSVIPADVTAAIQAQNTEVAAGEVGGLPQPTTNMLNATVTAQSRLTTPEQFREIIIKTLPSGATVRLSDVARIELGAENYASVTRMNRHPGAGIAVLSAPGADALKTADLVKAEIARVAKGFPPGLKIAYASDSTAFIKLSIEEVVKTLIEAIVLVVIVMFVFLQSWRATLIPTIAVPVVLLGTFAVFYLAGFSINTLTLFGLVLAIGLLVDDAIVVVENVERLMEEDPELTPRDATIKSMDEITVALIAIALVLSAVFLPMAFFGGSTGVIYRQFSITIVSAMVLSIMVALILTPALCAAILKPHDASKAEGTGLLARFFRWFNDKFDRGQKRYERGVRGTARRWGRSLVVYALIVVGMGFLFTRLPTGFLPDEDQGIMIALVQGPAGATTARTQKGLDLIKDHFLRQEGRNVQGVYTVNGFSFAGNGQNAGIAFIPLKQWDERGGADNKAPAIAGRAMGVFSRFTDAMIFAVVPPAVQELGNATGFDLQLVDQTGIGHAKLVAARNAMLGAASQDPTLVGVRPNAVEDAPQLKINVDHDKARALGLDLASVSSVISTAWGGSYINDFIDRGRVKRVYMQADDRFRMAPESIADLYVRGGTGTMAPFSAFSTLSWAQAPMQLTRYNGQPAIELLGQPAPGQSSGAAMAKMESLQARLAPDTALEWTGLSYEERLSGGQAPALFGLSLLIVFLCLAALYESWSVPISVLLVVPLGIVGALLAATLTGLNNDIYLQVGLITTIGVSAKNAILIVEFAEERMRAGMNAFDAAVEAAKLRLRPILMTSLAFIFGVFPLAIATGAGAGGQNAIGRAVVGGMLSATVLAIFFVPMFFVVVVRLFGRRDAKSDGEKGGGEQAQPTPTTPAPQGA